MFENFYINMLCHSGNFGRALDSGARGPGFEPHDYLIVSLSKTL